MLLNVGKQLAEFVNKYYSLKVGPT